MVLLPRFSTRILASSPGWIRDFKIPKRALTGGGSLAIDKEGSLQNAALTWLKA
jgi:hypothetical protein